MLQASQIGLTLLFPAVALWLARRVRVASWVGPVILCYLFGIMMANGQLMSNAILRTVSQAAPLQGWAMKFELAEALAFVGVAFSIPMLLFSADFLGWLKVAPRILISFVLMVVSVIVMAAGALWLWGDTIPEAWKVSAMLLGLYTGGSPNLSAIGLALGVKKSYFVLVNGMDVILGGAWFLFLLSGAKRFCLLFLPAYKSDDEAQAQRDEEKAAALEETVPTHAMLKGIAASVGIAILIVACAVGLSFVLHKKIAIATVVLVLTTLGIAVSFVPRLRRFHGSYDAGNYMLLSFCVAIGTMTDVKLLLNTQPKLLAYIALVMFGAIFLHFALAALLRLDADTVLITSTAGIYGAPFVVPVANALGNRQLIVSGLMTSLVGYALGNYLGLLMGQVFRWMVGV